MFHFEIYAFNSLFPSNIIFGVLEHPATIPYLLAGPWRAAPGWSDGGDHARADSCQSIGPTVTISITITVGPVYLLLLWTRPRAYRLALKCYEVRMGKGKEPKVGALCLAKDEEKEKKKNNRT